MSSLRMAYDGTQFKPSWDCRDPRGGQGVSIMPPYIMSLQITEADARRPPPTHTGSCSPSQHHTLPKQVAHSSLANNAHR